MRRSANDHPAAFFLDGETAPALPIQTIVFILAAIFAVVCGSAQTTTPQQEIDIARDSASLRVTFTGGLQSADTVAGPWADVSDATSPLTLPTNKPAGFFRVVGVPHINPENTQMKLKIGPSIFVATLEGSATATAFKAMLPLTINMSALNGNEKYSALSASLPTNASNPGTIHNGDLMLYGAQTVVLFYKTFSTSYSYTRLGRINDTTGLAAAVGSRSVTVTFESE